MWEENDENSITLSISISSTSDNYRSVTLSSGHHYDETWTVLVEQFIKALNAYGFIIKGRNQLDIDEYGTVTRTKINEGHTHE
jgi:hypothetical protein